ncbi:hypothetical protein LWI29_035956 [Acer saccharum]|uniref:Uncharacterized protein n=1 Tax=Acer saccharum TaxID=4024 RepID=A0AA39RQ45_ACESA|nr:hypothetical protein LWI29_035956 [Acer saccharum]
MTSFDGSQVNVSTGSGNNEVEDVEPSSASGGSKRKRKTSFVWNYMIRVDVNGVMMAKSTLPTAFPATLLVSSLPPSASSAGALPGPSQAATTPPPSPTGHQPNPPATFLSPPATLSNPPAACSPLSEMAARATKILGSSRHIQKQTPTPPSVSPAVVQ